MKLKEITKLLVVAALVLFVIPACVKEGPPGLDGADGADGANGVDGIDGADGEVACIVCHNDDNMNEIKAQFATSIHGTSMIQYTGQPTYIYAGAGENRKACAICHTHEGFVEWQFTGRDTLTSALAAPTHITCETCHSGHVSFDFETDGQDYALRAKGPVQLLMFDDPNRQIDFGTESNLCVNCHQPRTSEPTPDDDGNYFISSSHWGPHHGPQSTILEGIGGYEVAGSTEYPGTKSHPHRNNAGCTTCHMYEFESGEGGHTFEPSLASCTQCHGEQDNFDVGGVQAEVEELIHELQVLLQSAGAVDAEGHLVKGTYPIGVAGAAYNYAMMEDDRSMGVHNPDYIKALLKNSIESLE